MLGEGKWKCLVVIEVICGALLAIVLKPGRFSRAPLPKIYIVSLQIICAKFTKSQYKFALAIKVVGDKKQCHRCHRSLSHLKPRSLSHLNPTKALGKG